MTDRTENDDRTTPEDAPSSGAPSSTDEVVWPVWGGSSSASGDASAAEAGADEPEAGADEPDDSADEPEADLPGDEDESSEQADAVASSDEPASAVPDDEPAAAEPAGEPAAIEPAGEPAEVASAEADDEPPADSVADVDEPSAGDGTAADESPAASAADADEPSAEDETADEPPAVSAGDADEPPAQDVTAADEPEPEPTSETGPEAQAEAEAEQEHEAEAETEPQPENETEPEPVVVERPTVVGPAPVASDDAPIVVPEPHDTPTPAPIPTQHEAPVVAETRVEAPVAVEGSRIVRETAAGPVVERTSVFRAPGAAAAATAVAAGPSVATPPPGAAGSTDGAAGAPVATPAASTAPNVAPAPGAARRIDAGPVPPTPRKASPLDEFESHEPRRRWPRRVLVGAGVVVVLGLGYVGASYALADRVPRGTTVAGVDIGGLTADEAVARLEDELAAATTEPVDVIANGVEAQVDPETAGLTFDAQATVDGLTGLDLSNPGLLWAQIAGTGEQDAVTAVDESALRAALDALGTSLSGAPVDGSVMFVDGTAQATPAEDGWALDPTTAAETLGEDWLVAARPIELPTRTVAPQITQEETDAALDDVAEPLVTAPVSVLVDGELAVLQPEQVAAGASFVPEDGDLVLQLDGEALTTAVLAQLPTDLLTPAADAHFEFQDDKPVLVPGTPGTTLDPEALATAVASAASAAERTADVELSPTDPEDTTEAMKKLGVKEIVSEFSTPLTSEPRRTVNIAQGLENITGVLVRPGETFSLTEALGPIDAAHGFVQAGAIINGEHTDAWGGGLSQVSTTTFNAAFLAGFEDVEHTPHSEWFARYPEGREATIFTGVIDMRWKNDTPYGALMQGWVSGGRAYVRVWSTKYWTVETTTSGRSGVVQPSTVYSQSETCTPQSAGNPGFSVTVYRKIFLGEELKTDEQMSWRYKPQNKVVCGEKPDEE